jgi:hypothetical protein
VTVFNLRNGLSIDLTFGEPQILSPKLAEFDFDRTALYNSRLDAYPFAVDAFGRTLKSTQLVTMNATGVLSGASPDVFNKCSLRFMQFVKARIFEVQYFGKRKDEGVVTWAWSGDLLRRNNDCFVSQDGTEDSYPFQQVKAKSEHLPNNTLVAHLGDTPGAILPLSVKNRKNDFDNYLRSFIDRRSFESIVAFVHPDDSIQMLESWKWSFVRSVAVKWVKLEPAFDNTNLISFTKDASKTSVFGKDSDFDADLKSKRIANRFSREALLRPSTDKNVSYSEAAEAGVLPPAQFWSP